MVNLLWNIITLAFSLKEPENDNERAILAFARGVTFAIIGGVLIIGAIIWLLVHLLG